MIEVKKDIVITISGKEDVQCLSDLSELARVYLDQYPNALINSYNKHRTKEMMSELFDATS
jgi:hypothetical protein